MGWHENLLQSRPTIRFTGPNIAAPHATEDNMSAQTSSDVTSVENLNESVVGASIDNPERIWQFDDVCLLSVALTFFAGDT